MNSTATVATQSGPTRSQRLYTNTVLTLVAGLLFAMSLDRGQGSLISQANAQQGAHSGGDDGTDEAGRTNAAEQRKVMIAELRTLSSRMQNLETMLSKGINVKVTEMPPIQINDRSATEKKDDRKATEKQH